MRSPCRGVSIVTISALLVTSASVRLARGQAVGAEAEGQLVAAGSGEVRFEILGSEGPTPVMRVSFFERADDIPLTSEDLQAFESYVEEYGPIQLSEAQVQEFQLRVQSAIDSTDSSTPCSPEDYDGCYNQGVAECGGSIESGAIGAGAGRLVAPSGPQGILAGLLGAWVMTRLTCNFAVKLGCEAGCNDSGTYRCYPSGSCYETCPANTQPAYSSCSIGGVRGQCCSWNGPDPGEDNCVPPAVCYDDYCWGCPSSTTPGEGDCHGNNGGGGCGSCCIPTPPILQ